MKYQINFLDDLIVDSFAGGGGASIGIELALGRPVDIAINHDIQAVRMHEANHPFTRHFCENIFEVNPVKVCRGQRVALLWASPDCTHFSRAKGGKPVKKEIRGLAWVVIDWAKTVRPKVILLENVPEFLTWGPLNADNRPDKNRMGETFNEFVKTLKNLGYSVDWRVLRACDYGAPTSRKRLYLCARCDGKPILWAKPTHGNPNSAEVKSGKLLPYHTAAECINFSLPCPSIFTRKKSLAENTLKRIVRGLDKFVIKNGNPFIIPTNHGDQRAPVIGSNNYGNVGSSVSAPLGTTTTQTNHNCLYTPLLKHLTPFISSRYGNGNNGVRGREIKKPLPTITAQHLDHNQLITPTLISIGQTGGGNRINDILTPHNTVVSKAESCLVTPILTHYHSPTRENEARGISINKPIPVIDTSNRHALTIGYFSKAFGGNYNGAGSELSEPLHTVTAQDHNHLVTAFIHKYYREGAGSAAAEPLNTITAKERHFLNTAHLTVLRKNMDGKPLTEPIPTLTASGGHIGEVRTYLAHYTGEIFGHWTKIRTLLNKYGDYNLANDEIILFEINDEIYYISDIGMRMLTPCELFAAQGFPKDYIIDRDAHEKAYSKTEQVARCGNSVCPPVATALVKGFLADMAIKKPIQTMAELNKMIAV